MLREHPRETGGVTRLFAGRRGTGQEKRLRNAGVFCVESHQRQVTASRICALREIQNEPELASVQSSSKSPSFTQSEHKMGELIDGKAIAEQIKSQLKAEIGTLTEKVGRAPGLGVILVGDNPASKVYVTNKRKACDELNIFSEEYLLDKHAEERVLRQTIEQLNKDDRIDGILLQLPLPDHLDEDAMVSLIEPAKDVDGFHKLNLGRLLWGKELFVACTPLGVQQLLLHSGVRIEGSHVVIVGRSNIVGKPLATLLMQKKPGANATVTVCHSHTKNLREVTRTADILVAAMGSPRTITADMVRPGAVVVDVGINRIPDETRKSGYRLVGDVDFEAVKDVASKITPVPGGVGPMTIAMLMANTVRSFKMRNGLPV